MILIAQNESKREEQERQQNQRAVEREKFAQQRKNKVYEDIVFDSTAISQIHPKLHEVHVEHMKDIKEVIDIDSVQYDAEYFMTREDTDGFSGEVEGENKQGKPDIIDEIMGKGDQLISKVDKMLKDIGL